MRCLNCGGIGVVWNPDNETLWCIDCQTEPAGQEVEADTDGVRDENGVLWER